VITDASVAVDRHNDKTMDPLVVAVKVADGRHQFGYDNDLAYLLSPTVDSAGPMLTTWQANDTLRMLLPWPAGNLPRWLLVSLRYTAVSHTGERSECEGTMRSDTLRFAGRSGAPKTP
jgi:hypothetical protein